jgi:hypothetical protein
METRTAELKKPPVRDSQRHQMEIGASGQREAIEINLNGTKPENR